MSQTQQPSYPFMTVQVHPQGMQLSLVKSAFEAQIIIVPQENLLQFFAAYIPTLPHGMQQDLIAQIHRANKTNMDIEKAIKPIRLGGV